MRYERGLLKFRDYHDSMALREQFVYRVKGERDVIGIKMR
jgi:hypothetical protein